MTHLLMGKKQKRCFQCYLCGNRKDRFQKCCGHTMIRVKEGQDLLDWGPRTSLKEV